MSLLRRRFNPSRVYAIALARVVSNPNQPRRRVDPEALSALRESIRANGLLMPILVRPIEGGKRFELVAGQRRLLACRQLGWTEIPAMVRDLPAEEAARLSLLENLHRSNLTAVEEAGALRRLEAELPGGSRQELARRSGLSLEALDQRLRLLGLPILVQEAVIAGIVSAEHAEALLPLADAEMQFEALRRIHREGLSPRQTRQWVGDVLKLGRRLRRPAASAPPSTLPPVERAPPEAPAEGPLAALLGEAEELLAGAAAGQGGLGADLARFSGKVLQAVRSDPAGCLSWMPTGGSRGNLAGHLVRASSHALFLGDGLGLPARELELVGVSALLFDVGLAGIPPAILAKAGPLSGDERALVRRHVEEGGERLGRAGVEPRAIRIVLDHHERFDGTGYPRGVRGSGVDPLALWVGLVDMYTALTEQRPYRKPLTGRRAIQQVLLSGHRGIFPKHLLRDFVHAFGLFPVGSRVRLRSGREARVLRANPAAIHQPVVRLADGALLDLALDGDEIDSELA